MYRYSWKYLQILIHGRIILSLFWSINLIIWMLLSCYRGIYLTCLWRLPDPILAHNKWMTTLIAWSVKIFSNSCKTIDQQGAIGKFIRWPWKNYGTTMKLVMHYKYIFFSNTKCIVSFQTHSHWSIVPRYFEKDTYSHFVKMDKIWHFSVTRLVSVFSS